MPVVTRADCTQTNVKENYTFKIADGSMSSSLDSISLEYQACQGANNSNNNLRAFVKQLVNEGKLSGAELDIVDSRLVGDGKCPSAINSLLSSKDFKKGFDIEEDKWTFIVGEGFDDEKPSLDYRVLNERMEAQGDFQIVRRVCPSCSESHRDIYYRRFSPIPEGFNLLDTLMNNWFDTNNVHNEDFALYSTHLDAYLDTNRWTFCNFNDPGIGLPRECGPKGKVGSQWNAYWRNGGNANYHAFMVPADPLFESKIEYPTLATFLGSEFSPLWKGIQTSGTTVTHFDNGDYFTYPSVNFGDLGTTKAILVHYARDNMGGKVEIRLGGPSGNIIAEFSPAKTMGWTSYITATIGISEVEGIHDLTFVGRGKSGLMNLAWIELSDLAERAGELARIEPYKYSDQKNVQFGSTGNLGWFDDGDYVTYSQINFGEAGTTKGILMNYAKGNEGGRVEMRLGGSTGPIIAEFRPARTGQNWSSTTNITAYVGIDEVEGVHDLTFVGKSNYGIMSLKWFELSDFAERAEEHSRIEAYKYSTQLKTQFGSSANLGYFDKGDFVTYSKINFGEAGTTNTILMHYGRGKNGGSIEVRLGSQTGEIIKEISLPSTGGWDIKVTKPISISGVEGVHDLTFVGKGTSGLMNLVWFELQ